MHLKRGSFDGDHFISCTGTDARYLTDPVSVTNFYHYEFVIQDPIAKSFLVLMICFFYGNT